MPANEEEAGVRQAFGARIRELLDERDLSPYGVQRLSGGTISHQTVRNMMDGHMPSSDMILIFARAINADANELLKLAGRELRVPDESGETAGKPAPDPPAGQERKQRPPQLLAVVTG